MNKGYAKMQRPLSERALEFFLEHPSQEVYLREYGRLLKISPNSAQRFLNRFVAQGHLLEQRRGHLRFFKANLGSMMFRQAKVLFSLRELQEAGIIEALKERASHAVLFGSVAQGTDDEQSDIDIVVISSLKDELRKVLLEIQKRLSRELSVQIFSWAEWTKQEKNNKAFYRDVMIKGISLLGEKPIAS